MKSMLTKFVLVLCVVLGLLAWPAQSSADITSSGSWLLTESNTFADGVNYGVVDIVADSTAGTVTFTVTAFDVQPLYGPLDNFGIQAFGFNSALDPSGWSVALPDGWSQDSGNLDGFGFFAVSEDGVGWNRQNPLVFTITLDDASQAVVGNFVLMSTGTAGEGHAYFAAHVAGFGTGPGSHYIAAVPAPGAVLLAAMGLGLIGCGRSVFCRSNE
jgi:hypothetical protein